MRTGAALRVAADSHTSAHVDTGTDTQVAEGALAGLVQAGGEAEKPLRSGRLAPRAMVLDRPRAQGAGHSRFGRSNSSRVGPLPLVRHRLFWSDTPRLPLGSSYFTEMFRDLERKRSVERRHR